MILCLALVTATYNCLSSKMDLSLCSMVALTFSFKLNYDNASTIMSSTIMLMYFMLIYNNSLLVIHTHPHPPSLSQLLNYLTSSIIQKK